MKLQRRSDLSIITKIKDPVSKKSSNWTINQDTKKFKIWTFFKLGVNILITLMYPYYNVNGFPPYKSYKFIQLVLLDSVFFFDIILNFFLQELDEKGHSKNQPLEIIAENYLRGDFLLDMIVFVPWGGIFSLVDNRLKFLWLIKALRIKDLMRYMSKRQFN